jgi:hypothetical protein
MSSNTAPRIVQVLDVIAADAAVEALGRSKNYIIVGLDDLGQLWCLANAPATSVSTIDRGRLEWSRLPLPPLPDDGGER